MLIVLTGRSPSQATDPRRIWAFSCLARAADQFHLPLVVTTPHSCFSPGSPLAGWTYQSGAWVVSKSLVRQPVLYDAMYLADLKREKHRYKRFLERVRMAGVPLFNPVLPAKDVVYQTLQNDELVYGALPFTVFAPTVPDVVRILRRRPELWLKPVYGSGGRNMLLVQRIDDNRYKVVGQRFYGRRIRGEMDKQELRNLLGYAMERRRYMLQENLQLLRTQAGQKVDFRVTVQRNDTGRWYVTAITARMGRAGSLLTNYHAGGRVLSLTRMSGEVEQFLSGLGVRKYQLRVARDFALSVARRLEQHFPTLGALGLDIGLTRDGRQYVYDCNGRPGRDILTNEEVSTFMDFIVGYAKFTEHLSYPRKAGKAH